MRISVITILALAVLLSGCNGTQTSTFNWNSAQLIYSYPDNAQKEVPRKSPIVLEFSTALPSQVPSGTFKVQDSNGNSVSFSSKEVNNDRTLVLTPDSELAPHTHYTVTAGTLKTSEGNLVMPSGGVQFDTRAAIQGPASAVSEGEFGVARMIPDGQQLPLMDFSTLRLQFTQPLDNSTVNYGSDISLKDAKGQLVDATVIAHGPYLTIDPKQTLTAGAQYTLSLSSGLTSTLGNSLNPGAFADKTFTPKDSSPRTVMVQHAGDSNNGSLLSPLTGDPINEVPIHSVLLGNNSSPQQTGDVQVQLAFVPHYPKVTPFRIAKDTLLNGSSVSVNIAGKVPAGFDTGAIGVRFISNATGFLTPNHYSDSASAPRTVYLFMDLAMTTANGKANAGLSQDLMHVELVGTSIVRNGQMIIDAVGVVQPKILGLENASAVVSFHMAGYKDQTNPPQPPADTTLPTLQSWEPDNNAAMARPGDPIVLNFSEPLSRSSLKTSGAVTLLANGTPVSFQQSLDGGTLVLHPKGGLQFGTQYQVQVSSQVTDLAGNPLDQTYNLSFSMPDYLTSNPHSPIVTSVDPGYPCAVSTVSQDLANNQEGRCLGGVNADPADNYGYSNTEDQTYTSRPKDDILPVETQPADRPIRVNFSQNMDASSIRLGTGCSDTSATFRVEKIDASGSCQEAVPGHLTVGARSLTFTPDQPWSNGQLYRYVLASTENAPSCNGNDAICSSAGQALETAVLEKEGSGKTHPDMVIDFRGGPASGNVYTPLKNLPTADVNANFSYESGEPGPTPSDPTANLENSTQLKVTGTVGSVTSASVGCDSSQTCPSKKYVFLTGALNTEVVGYDPAKDAVQVKLHPTVLVTSSVDIYSTVAGLVKSQTPTGPQIMRLRYQKDANGVRDQLIDGYIHSTTNGPVFTTTVDAYLDAPNLVAPFSSQDNMYSVPVTLQLSGPVKFLGDGRMEIGQLNSSAVNIDVKLEPLTSSSTTGTLVNTVNTILGGLASLLSGTSSTQTINYLESDINLQIPVNGADLNYISPPVKP